MLNIENFSPNLLSRKGIWIFIFFFTVLLFVVTGLTQFSCYPMITDGVLPKFCNSQENKLEIIQDNRTHWNTLLHIASDPNTDENTLRAIAFSLDSQKVGKNLKNMLQRALAFNPKTPIDVLYVLIESGDIDILENIAKRPDAYPELLRKVAESPYIGDFKLQKALVNNPQVPQRVFEKF